MPRVGTPDEIAQMVVFLLSDATTFTTGSVFSADGGWDP
jgi:NAD(P)-dependent dehydrogenase (short-subunit alcohol dehydrogenase family)